MRFLLLLLVAALGVACGPTHRTEVYHDDISHETYHEPTTIVHHNSGYHRPAVVVETPIVLGGGGYNDGYGRRDGTTVNKTVINKTTVVNNGTKNSKGTNTRASKETGTKTSYSPQGQKKVVPKKPVYKPKPRPTTRSRSTSKSGSRRR